MSTALTAEPSPQTLGPPRTALRSRLPQIGRWLAILLMAGTFGFPLYWTVTMSFKPF